MKFKYKKYAAVTIYVLLFLLIVVGYICLYPDFYRRTSGSEAFGRATTRNGFIVIYLAFAIRYFPEKWNRYVELHETYMECHSFRYPFRMQTMSLHLKYANVYKITYKRGLFFFGKIAIYENSLSYPIRLNCGFHNYRKLYAEICRRVSEANPKAELSKKLLKT